MEEVKTIQKGNVRGWIGDKGGEKATEEESDKKEKKSDKNEEKVTKKRKKVTKKRKKSDKKEEKVTKREKSEKADQDDSFPPLVLYCSWPK